ncbi:unnamed protein product (macronuclear) [Paramecium tetraurelia]|nr:uncharacterized protein GSPATT00038943001 [Paramecium tetraurelia]CAK73925.1 unnamed protein product [Paramecium tetraurelia]|eukprot:XP_001441322.1 hypothetical protein (macronuclear) [Paramecium tetraurelia strain d4-2]
MISKSALQLVLQGNWSPSHNPPQSFTNYPGYFCIITIRLLALSLPQSNGTNTFNFVHKIMIYSISLLQNPHNLCSTLFNKITSVILKFKIQCIQSSNPNQTRFVNITLPGDISKSSEYTKIKYSFSSQSKTQYCSSIKTKVNNFCYTKS